MGRNPKLLSPRAALRRAGLILLACAPVVFPAGALAQAESTTVQPPKPTESRSGAPAVGGFSARALDENGQLTPQTYFEVELDPGDSWSGELLVSNTTRQAMRLRAYPVDGLTGATSGTVYANIDDPVKETGNWITPSKELLRLAPNTERKLGFTVKVPADARPGDHVGAVAFQSADEPDAEGEGQVQITEIIRVAVAVQIKVSGPASASLKIDDLGLEALGGTAIPSVLVKMNNNGQLLCRPALEVTLFQQGRPLGRVERQLDTILAGDVIDFPLPWPRALDAGTYTAKAVSTGCGKQSELEQEVELAGDLAGSTSVPGTAPTDDGSDIPWWAFAIGGVVLLLAIWLVARARRKAKRAEAELAEARQAAARAEAEAAAAKVKADAAAKRNR